MKKFDEIKKVIAEMEQDVVKLDKGVKAAGPRVRAGLMKIKELAHEGRKEVSENLTKPTTDLLKAPRLEAK